MSLATPFQHSVDSIDKDGLREVTWPRFLRAPDARLLQELYEPGLTRSISYDRSCAYFSSRVLAVAARGFGGFIQNLLEGGEALPRPAIRLLVNQHLEAADVDALLADGNDDRLLETLLTRWSTPADALERARLEMLAWLIASGWAEVRVGVMRRTGGIAHAKFGILTDHRGDRLAFMGSDNETGAALQENYEELELRPSWQDAEFVDYYRSRFDDLWAGRDSFVATVPLPDALRLKLIDLAPEAPPRRERQAAKTDAATAMLWHFIASAPFLPDGHATVDATAPVDLWPHQRHVIEDTFTAFPAGRLLCDEVGMGKTIEAIMVLRRLVCGRGVQRALIMVPAGLLKQWQDELREKGALIVPRWESGYLHWPNGDKEALEAPAALAAHPLLLISREWARLSGNRDVLLSVPPWDLILLDEAHAARRSQPDEGGFNAANLLLHLLRDLQLRRRTRGILLLSATPMQTQPWEPWDLLGVLGVGGAWMADFAEVRRFYDAAATLHNGNSLTDSAPVARLIAGDDEFSPPPAIAEGGSEALESSLESALGFAFGHEAEGLARWMRRGAPLGRRMHRNTRDTLREYHQRGLLASAPPRRKVRDVIFDYRFEAERQCYDAISGYINGRFSSLENEKKGKGFVMTIYRRRAASSPQALRCSLQRRLEGLDRVIKRHHHASWLDLEAEEIDWRDLSDAGFDEQIDPALPSTPEEATREKAQVETLLQRLNDLGQVDSKLEKFWDVLQEITGDGRAALVFTEYSDTMEYLRDQLRASLGEMLGCYSGAGGQIWAGDQWAVTSKSEITQRLREGRIKVLLCTDAASEGLNLQAAGALVNYDLPWNPSRVEQRIGRIDRIGQQQPVLPVVNLFLSNSVDMQVYKVLSVRCGLFEHFVGPMQPVLARAREALRSNLSPAQTSQIIKELESEAVKSQSDRIAHETYLTSSAEPLVTVPAALALEDVEFALEALSQGDSSIACRRDGERWILEGDHVEGVQITTSREVLERDRDVTPFSFQMPVLHQILEQLALPSHAPLILTEYKEGAYRCCEAYWVSEGGAVPVTSFSQLQSLIAAWDGIMPPPDLMAQTQRLAQAEASARVSALSGVAKDQEARASKRQVDAARQRLLRELGRTLRCYRTGDLNAIFQEQLQRETRADGRYHLAFKLLNGMPNWAYHDLQQIGRTVEAMRPADRRARLAGSEVDAALNDPRWLALDSYS